VQAEERAASSATEDSPARDAQAPRGLRRRVQRPDDGLPGREPGQSLGQELRENFGRSELVSQGARGSRGIGAEFVEPVERLAEECRAGLIG